ncbi:MAG: hypothetical protein MZU84_06275 [Sphingobacterium sp.]|nr:hypothetical protein [Sphingobacterium sp.]
MRQPRCVAGSRRRLFATAHEAGARTARRRPHRNLRLAVEAARRALGLAAHDVQIVAAPGHGRRQDRRAADGRGQDAGRGLRRPPRTRSPAGPSTS